MTVPEIELKALRMHWAEGSDQFADCCVHGGVYLRIGDIIISDGKADWTISTAAFRFLRTIFFDHLAVTSDYLIPCCGFNMWVIETAEDGLAIPNCNYGVDWSATHEGNTIVHTLSKAVSLHTSVTDWAKAVCQFSDEVFSFLNNSSPKIISDEEDRKGFDLFIKLWKERRAAAEDLVNANGTAN